MKVYGIIPSRFGSSRFPGKPLASLAGKPLVAWVVEAVKKAASLDEVLVATDDARIVAAVEQYGGKAVMTPSELPSGTDRIACAAGAFADDDILVNVQGDEPLIDPKLIDELVAKLTSTDRFDMATAVTPIRSLDDYQSKTVVKAVLAQDDSALYFSRAPIPCNRDNAPVFPTNTQQPHPTTNNQQPTTNNQQPHPITNNQQPTTNNYYRHLGIYAYRGAFLKRYIREPQCALEKTEKLEQLRALWMGAKIAVVRTEDEGVGVDTPEDAVRVEKLLLARQS